MYNFRDVNEISEGYILPSEAMKINGEYIESQINGYRTLHVMGREALSPELSYIETGARDGSALKSRRYPVRTISVTYQLIADSPAAFRDAFNKLGSILNVENAQLIFNDEPDKFFIGTPAAIGNVDPGKNAVVGEIVIDCLDPFKYSVEEYEATTDLDGSSILIDYNGTYKAYPTLEAEFFNENEAGEDGETETALTGDGDCGYVAFFNEKEKIIQLGDPDEVDAESYAKSQTLINCTYNKSTSWGLVAQSMWDLNKGNLEVTKGDSGSLISQVGSFAMGAAAWTTPKIPGTSGTLLETKCTAEKPNVWYTITAKTANRQENSVQVTVSISAALEKSSNFFGRGFGLVAAIYLGGKWYEKTLKTTSERWSGTKKHTISITATVTNIEAETDVLDGIKFKVTRDDSADDGGNTGKMDETTCNELPISPYQAPYVNSVFLVPGDYGTGSGWHGPSISRDIPADAAGDVGAKHFKLTYKQKIAHSWSNGEKQLGSFICNITDASGNNVIMLKISKASAGKRAQLWIYIGGQYATVKTFDLNSVFFSSGGTTTITKDGRYITINFCGTVYTFTNATLGDATKVSFAFNKYANSPALGYNGLYWVKFVKDQCDTYSNVPNKFSANDVVQADCNSGEVLLNGIPAPSLGALGNDWENFYLSPGLNQIGVAYSDWVVDGYAPKFKVKYRERFL